MTNLNLRQELNYAIRGQVNNELRNLSGAVDLVNEFIDVISSSTQIPANEIIKQLCFDNGIVLDTENRVGQIGSVQKCTQVDSIVQKCTQGKKYHNSLSDEVYEEIVRRLMCKHKICVIAEEMKVGRNTIGKIRKKLGLYTL